MNTKSKTFCILPFIHLYADPNGEMKPCCISGGFDEPIYLNKTTIEDSFNSPQMKQLRKDMLDGKRNKVCDSCYKREDSTNNSPRIQYNDIIGKMWEIPNINNDYTVPTDFQYVDVRFSNLCNFKCRMCFHTFSSNWYEDSIIARESYKPKSKVIKVSDTIVDDLKPYLSKLKNIYFAGGEPLIMPEHFKILKYLHDNSKIDKYTKKIPISIHYNTNLSVIKYDEKSLIDLWKKFYKVLLSISCDGIGEVGEYQRTGFKTKTFENNLNILKKYATPTNVFNATKGLFYSFQYTTTIMNVYHIFDFIDYMLEKNHITDSEQIDFYYAWAPSEYSLSQLPIKEKEKIENFIKEKINNYSEKTKKELNQIIDFLNSDIIPIGQNQGVKSNYIEVVDSLHGGNFEKISKIKLGNNL
jgi:organic radical activating enzyme